MQEESTLRAVSHMSKVYLTLISKLQDDIGDPKLFLLSSHLKIIVLNMKACHRKLKA